jgi:hypothetical protein
MIATVQDLIDQLEEYGGHLPARMLLPPTSLVGTLQRRDEEVVLALAVDDQTIDGETTVILAPEV